MQKFGLVFLLFPYLNGFVFRGNKISSRQIAQRPEISAPSTTNNLLTPIKVNAGLEFARNLCLNAKLTQIQPDTESDNEVIEGMPNRQEFLAYFKESCSPEGKLFLDFFKQYPPIAELLAEEKIIARDIEELWLSFDMDTTVGLDQNDAYELLCMTMDLPDPEAEKDWQRSYKKLTKTSKDAMLSFYNFVAWKEIQEILGDEVLTMEDLSKLWKSVTKDQNSLDEKIDLKQFLLLNRRLDILLDDRNEDDEEREGEGDEGDEEEGQGEEEDDLAATLRLSANVWSPSFQMDAIFDEEIITELTEMYENLIKVSKKKSGKGLGSKLKSSSGLLEVSKFLAWEEIQDLLKEDGNQVTEAMLVELFQEAVEYYRTKKQQEKSEDGAEEEVEEEEGTKKLKKAKKGFGSSAATSTVSGGRGAEEVSGIDLDAFLRLNVKLEILIMEKKGQAGAADEEDEEEEEVKKAVAAPVAAPAAAKEAAPAGEDQVDFYTSEFTRLVSNKQDKNYLTLAELLQWSEIKELLQDAVLTEAQVKQIYQSMPKVKSAEGGEGKEGIALSSFLAFNNMLDIVLDVSSNAVANNSKKEAAAVPSALINEPALPAPKTKALTSDMLRDLDQARQKEIAEDAEGISANEQQLFEILDQADAILQSRSFTSFDQLIGDTNDPRLASKKMLEEEEADLSLGSGSGSKGGEQAILQELISLAKSSAISRAGLDLPEEVTVQQLRSFFQRTLDATIPPLVSRPSAVKQVKTALNGQWRLLYTNSEMFRFYNGLTGFTNVLPGAKFQSVTFDYFTDGYLSESQYYEQLTTPLGPVEAKVFANWDLIEEVSFMTNENSLVLRNYVNKVTAGPFDYRAEENWKSLRTMAMNEVVYLDDRYLLLRNAGALRIFFVLEKVGDTKLRV